jgi:plasmid stability protein
MNQLTLRHLPKNTESLLRTAAKKSGKSLNKTAIDLLNKSLGLSDSSRKKRSFAGCSGTWSKEEVDEFNCNTKVFETIDPDMWK